MPEATTPAIVLKVTCGQVLNTTINGVAVQIDCQGSAPVAPGGWVVPTPPSASGGVVAIAEIPARGPRLDLGALAGAFGADELDRHLTPLEPHQSAAIVFERPGGARVSLDALMVEPDA